MTNEASNPLESTRAKATQRLHLSESSIAPPEEDSRDCGRKRRREDEDLEDEDKDSNWDEEDDAAAIPQEGLAQVFSLL